MDCILLRSVRLTYLANMLIYTVGPTTHQEQQLVHSPCPPSSVPLPHHSHPETHPFELLLSGQSILFPPSTDPTLLSSSLLPNIPQYLPLIAFQDTIFISCTRPNLFRGVEEYPSLFQAPLTPSTLPLTPTSLLSLSTTCFTLVHPASTPALQLTSTIRYTAALSAIDFALRNATASQPRPSTSSLPSPPSPFTNFSPPPAFPPPAAPLTTTAGSPTHPAWPSSFSYTARMPAHAPRPPAASSKPRGPPPQRVCRRRVAARAVGGARRGEGSRALSHGFFWRWRVRVWVMAEGRMGGGREERAGGGCGAEAVAPAPAPAGMDEEGFVGAVMADGLVVRGIGCCERGRTVSCCAHILVGAL
ncbi:hypothetical protein B0J12DRAFT_14981 [Macrophomina phaseolina]|uniref:Uncharacterized protein n=1 Tax=Macrophomina phaseolina TaxID=35725 RepID=A0ABQ8GUD7_9PEZI|nr:hypothetical protein B0J12DRAFT_14981 [Macrophomina phaseolina]